MTWRVYNLSEITAKITKGTTPTSLGYNFKSKGINYIKAESFNDSGEFLTNKFAFIDKECHSVLRRSILQENDVLFTIAGVLGRCTIVKKEILPANTNQAVAIIRLNDEIKAMPEFVRYWLSQDIIRRKVNLEKIQSAQPNINLKQLGSIEIAIPNFNTQKQIVNILSAYDDLIENNLKRIKLLEQASQNIYKEWFVNMRFPGYEEAKFDSETGLPEGWEIDDLSKHIDFKEGPGLRNWQYRDKGIPFLNIRMMNSGNLDFSSVKFLDKEEIDKKYKHFLLEEFDHILSTSGTLGKVVTIRKSHLPLCLNTSIIRLRPIHPRIGKWYIKRKVSSQEFINEMKSYATGSAQLNFGPKHLKMMKIVVPNKELSIDFERLTGPIEIKVLKLLDLNEKLKQARDILLPRLMNQTIEV